jgi:hypothetical protein
MGVDGVLGHPVLAGDLALQLGGCGDGRRRSEGGPDDGDRSRPRARGGGGEEEKHEDGRAEEKVLVVAKQPHEGGAS